jgi:hypothetical protein
MTKLNIILFFLTLLFGALIAGALGQTVMRNRELEALRTEISNAIKDTPGMDNAVAVIQSYEEEIKYAYEHKPLLNLDIGLSESFAAKKSELCPDIYTVMTNNLVIMHFLDNTNLQIEDKANAKEQINEIQQAAKSLFFISGCLP